MKKLSILVSTAILTIPLATIQAGDFSYTYLEGTYNSYDESIVDSTTEIVGSIELNNAMYLKGSYEQVDIDSPYNHYIKEMSLLSMGVGAYASLSDRTDSFIEVSYLGLEADGVHRSNDSGVGFAGGIRHLLTPNLEAEGKLSHVVLDKSNIDETTIDLKARYHFSNRFSAGVGVSADEDSDKILNSSIRFSSL